MWQAGNTQNQQSSVYDVWLAAQSLPCSTCLARTTAWLLHSAAHCHPWKAVPEAAAEPAHTQYVTGVLHQVDVCRENRRQWEFYCCSKACCHCSGKAGWHPYTKRTCCCWASPVQGSGANSDAGGCCWVSTALDTHSLALCDQLLLLCWCSTQLRTSCCALRCWLRHNTWLCMLGSGEQANVRDWAAGGGSLRM